MLIRSSLPTNPQPDPLFAEQSLGIAGHGNNAPYNYDNAQIWYDNKKPVVSIIIVNFNNAEMTHRCLQAVWCYTCGHHYEVLVIDNGSVSHDYMQLQSLPGRFKLLRLSINRFFGEANNIGVEESRGNFLVFLNNDAFVTEGWLEPLIQTLTIKADAGGVGPKFIYPDGRLQEAGAFIRLDGKSDQLGRGGDPNLPLYNAEREVHYCSAATLALRRDVFYNALGFDLAWEPGYYEDSDLCLKIQTLGFKIYYCPFSTVVHLENKTTGSTKHNLKLHNVVDINRLKFLDRWQYLLKGDKQNVKPLIRSPFPPVPTFTNSKKIALYTSYEIIPGGGERYLLSMAEFLSQKFDVILLTPERYSRFRLLTIARELQLNLDRVSLAPLYAKQQTVSFDLFVLMGNELLPEFPGLGRKNIYHCQFPFPINSDQFSARIQNWSTYDQIIVNSNFTKNAIERGIRRFRLPRRHIEVVYPPVQVFLDKGCVPNKENIILSVGRIFSGGHNKRHDQMILAFRRLHDISGVKAELHFVGALHPGPEHRDHFLHLQALSSDLPVYFHLNASPEDLEKLYSRALVYWHMTGFDVDSHQNPELCEHFGITVIEAMSASCIPVVVGKGGPQETVTPGVSGFHFHRIDELVELTGKIFISKDELWVRQMQQEARNASLGFSKTVFIEHLSRILDQLEFSCE
jgi:GT2 family glycosyltransferase